MNVAANIGPRQPWHDCHMMVEGEATSDILDNFQERIRKQSPESVDLLYNITPEEFDSHIYEEENSWNVQFFRCINSDSVSFESVPKKFLKSSRGFYYDDSIQTAYVHHIRRAKRFIYIENQFFYGSSHYWKQPIPDCTHKIPIEIALRIVKAIRLNEQFRVYVLIPIHPESDPTSTTTQQILSFQFQTMEMMYQKIAKAIKEAGTDADPTDYLSFFCLTKREHPNSLPDGLQDPIKNKIAENARKSLSFMIYIHSKMAIFDDEYIIIGSANINMRSMDGNRDTEMAFGAYQPNLLSDGDIQTYRLALWAAHCGEVIQIDPQSIECITALKKLGKLNMQEYLDAQSPTPSTSHLMTYPLKFDLDGSVRELSYCTTFPITGGSIKGKNAVGLPMQILT